MRRGRHTRLVLAGAVATLVATGTATGRAQDKVYFFDVGSLKQIRVTAAGTLTPGREDRLPPHTALAPPQPVDGGRALVWPVAFSTAYPPTVASIAVYDTRTGSAGLLPGLAFGAAEGGGGWLPRVVADRSRPVLFVIDANFAIHRVEPGAHAPLVTLPSFSAGSYLLGAAVRDTRLFVWRSVPGFDIGDFFVINTQTGTIERTVMPLTEGVVHISGDGRRVYLGSGSDGQPRALRAVDPASWTEVVRREWPGLFGAPFVLTSDETRSLLALPGNGIRTIQFSLLDDVSLQDLGTVDTATPMDSRMVRGFAHAGGQAPLFYLSQLIAPGYADQCELNLPRLEVVSGRTGRFLAELDLGNRCPFLIPVSPPLPPTSLSATVSGNDVALAWTPPLDASSFVMEAGSAPGLHNLVVLPLGRDPVLLVPAVPPGTYFVRIRGVNEQGTGPPSNEVQVTVP